MEYCGWYLSLHTSGQLQLRDQGWRSDHVVRSIVPHCALYGTWLGFTMPTLLCTVLILGRSVFIDTRGPGASFLPARVELMCVHTTACHKCAVSSSISRRRLFAGPHWARFREPRGDFQILRMAGRGRRICWIIGQLLFIPTVFFIDVRH
ncbi:hypothetical protein F4825DRAFT_206672 [Nemania diffusa]|nr:hypothetical protein F4825DRAFT_206672 [Nemania diffusa]